MTAQFHEVYRRAGAEPSASERSFGLLFTAVFALIALWPVLAGGGVRWWAMGLAAATCVLAVAAPKLLAPFNRAWTGLGKILHRIVSPLVLGVLFLVAVVPTGLYLRITGADPLRLKRDRDAKTYWLVRDPPGPDVTSFKNQF